MQVEWQIKRADLFWLMGAFSAVCLLHIQQLPFWISLLLMAIILWRIQQYRGRLMTPLWPVKAAVVLASSGGILLQFGTLIGLEPMLALLTTGTMLKFIEMHTRRDAFIIICAGYFLAAIACIFSQSIFVFLLVLLCMLILTAAMVAIGQSRTINFSLLPFKTAAFALMAAVPLMLVMFLVMPRIGALWALPGPQKQGVTGISNTMSPGDFTKLSRSAELAFRVSFDGEKPLLQKLYWRGLVLSNFDGRQWTQSSFISSSALLSKDAAYEFTRKIQYFGEPISYAVVLQPTYSRWLFTLSAPRVPIQKNLFLTRDLSLISRDEIYSRMNYQMQAWTNYQFEPVQLDSYRRHLELSLPRGYNPETARIARQWSAEAEMPQQLISRVLKLFNQSFVYTLEPPALGRHSVDEFLWQTRRGFCEHFASSFVFFMRAAGIPARVVTGYQGGEYHPTDNFLTVRQYDAHAWAEVWLQDQGWVRVDPTAAVAPERIEVGYSEFFSEREAFLNNSGFSLLKYRHFNVMNWLQLKMDTLDFAWATWVLGYERQQNALLEKLLGKVNPLRIALFMFVGAALSFLPLLVLMALKRNANKINPLDKLYLKFCSKVEKAGLSRRNGEGPEDFSKRIILRFPKVEKSVFNITKIYIKQRYGVVVKSDLKAMSTAVQQLNVK